MAELIEENMEGLIELEEKVRLLDQRVQEHWNHNYETINKLSIRIITLEARAREIDDLKAHVNSMLSKKKDLSTQIPNILEGLKELEGRMCELEDYFSDDKFHDVLKALNALENEFADKAAKLVAKIASGGK